MLCRLAFAAAISVSLSACELVTEACTRELGFVVNPADATIQVGQTIQVAAHGTSCGGSEVIAFDVQWESSDSAVIRVEPDGKVTGLSEGSALAIGVDRGPYAGGPFKVSVEVVE